MRSARSAIDVWNEPERAQALGQERAALEKVVVTLDELSSGLTDAEELLALAEEEDDSGTVDDVAHDLAGFEIIGVESAQLIVEQIASLQAAHG